MPAYGSVWPEFEPDPEPEAEPDPEPEPEPEFEFVGCALVVRSLDRDTGVVVGALLDVDGVLVSLDRDDEDVVVGVLLDVDGVLVSLDVDEVLVSLDRDSEDVVVGVLLDVDGAGSLADFVVVAAGFGVVVGGVVPLVSL